MKFSEREIEFIQRCKLLGEQKQHIMLAERNATGQEKDRLRKLREEINDELGQLIHDIQLEKIFHLNGIEHA